MSSQSDSDSHSHALRALQKTQSTLLDKIDSLRTLGLNDLIDLPQLIVCGNQSSGKSSVLEAISRVRFPAKSNVCTRFATEVILRRSESARVKISIEPGPSRVVEEDIRRIRGFRYEGFEGGDGLPGVIEEAKGCMGLDESVGSGFSDDVLKVDISGPDKPELTLVDLPGLYTSVSDEQGREGIRVVRYLTEKYMKNSRSIILAVISAKTDYHLQAVLNMAEGFDKSRERTMGIITQPDILESGSEEEESYLQFLRNEKLHLKLGWHALRNRSFETRDVSDEARDVNEKAFFASGKWQTISRENVGIDSLRRRLSGILMKHIQHNLPGLIADIQTKIAEREQKLLKLGPSRSTLQQQRGFLLSISSDFERITGQALNGMYADKFFAEMKDKDDNGLLRANIRQLNEYFAEAMNIRGGRRKILPDFQLGVKVQADPSPENPYMKGWKRDPVARHVLAEEISEMARQQRGIELPGSANQLLVGTLFRDQSQPWEGLARMHLLRAWDAVRYFVFVVLRHLTDSHTSSLLASLIMEPELERMKDALLSKLEELTSYTKRGHPLPIGKSFLTQIQKARNDRLLESLRGKLVFSSANFGDPSAGISMASIERAIADLDKSSDGFAAAEILDQMQAYYDIAILTFVDNIATLGIENCLLEPLQRILTSQTVNNMDEIQIDELASEPSYVSEERARLSKELEKLRAGVQTFNAFRPLVPPSKPPGGVDKPSPTPDTSGRSPRALKKAPVNKPSQSSGTTRDSQSNVFGSASETTPGPPTQNMFAWLQNEGSGTTSASTGLGASPKRTPSKSPGSLTDKSTTGGGFFNIPPTPNPSSNSTHGSGFGAQKSAFGTSVASSPTPTPFSGFGAPAATFSSTAGRSSSNTQPASNSGLSPKDSTLGPAFGSGASVSGSRK